MIGADFKMRIMKSKSTLLAMSTVADGSMSKAVPAHERDENRKRFLKKHGCTLERTALVHLTYAAHTYRRYMTIDEAFGGHGLVSYPTIEVDALFTTSRELALFLPVADCVAAVLYDPENAVLGLSHLGRHNLLQQGGTASITYMTEEFGTDPTIVQVWLGPAAGAGNYPLFDFDGRSLHDVSTEQLLAAGVKSVNIRIDSRDTTTDGSLFSHSQFLKGKQAIDGRQAVVCMMRSA
jgi:hypothetical protein